MKNTEKKDVNPKRLELRKLSVRAKAMRELDPELGECTINEIIINRFYSKNGNSEFHSYRAWRELGHQVKRGEKAFVIWGRKRKAEKTEVKKGESEEFKFYPLAFLFSNKQVEKINLVVEDV